MLKRISKRSGDGVIIEGLQDEAVSVGNAHGHGDDVGCQSMLKCINCSATPRSSPDAKNYVTSPSDDKLSPSNNDNSGQTVLVEEIDGSFSTVVNWINQNLPCMSGAADHVDISQEHADTNETQSVHQPLDKNDTLAGQSSVDSSSWCGLSAIAPCPVSKDQQQDEFVSNDANQALSKDQSLQSQMPGQNQLLSSAANPSSNTASNHQASSWLSGHLGLIPAPSQANALTKSPSLVKPVSLTNHPSSTEVTITNTRSSSLKPTRSRSPLTTMQSISIKRNVSQLLKITHSTSRSHSRSNSPNNLEGSCEPMQCLSNNHSSDRIDSNSSVGLNSIKGSAQLTNCSNPPSSTCTVEPIVFTCVGNNSDDSILHQAPSNHSMDRAQSKLRASSIDSDWRAYNASIWRSILTRQHADAKSENMESEKSPSKSTTDNTESSNGVVEADISISGGASKRKVQWRGGNKNVLITVNEDSAEVTNRERKSKIDVRSFASYHEDIVTALIETALKAEHDLDELSLSASCATEPVSNPPSAADVSTPMKPSFSPIRKMKCNSPHRACLATSTWKRNKSSSKLEHVGKMKQGRKVSESNDHVENPSMFLFKAKHNTSSSTHATSLEKQPLDYFHPECWLLKEKGSNKCKVTSDGKIASAVGKCAVLEKLQEKLSMLGDIESGKFGKAAEMLQSDAVAFVIDGTDVTDKSKSYCSSTTLGRANSITFQDSTCETADKRKTLVETRSLLTIRMGFVSMSYGILLQWDYDSRLVELIILRKLAREDFLDGNEDTTDSSTAAATTSTKPSTASLESAVSDIVSESNGYRKQEVDGYTGMNFFPQLLSEPDQKPDSFLSVSVVNIKNIHTGCNMCLDPKISNEHIGKESKEKRHVIRPYVRFVLGKNGHCTKPAKLLPNGHLHYYKRHHNSCLLPMPKEEFRWFAGQEDLVVEVRDMQSKDSHKNDSRKALHMKMNAKSSARSEQSSSNDPMIAVVTIPLSSVNIEDEENKALPRNESVALAPWKHFKAKKHDIDIGRNETSASTNVTLPLRMVGCSSTTSFGSISLQITVKVPQSGTHSSSQRNRSTSETIGAAEESIEISRISRIVQGWTTYDSAVDEKNHESSSKSQKIRTRKPQPRWNKKWNPKTKKWNKLKLNNYSSSKDTNSDQADWFAFFKWGDEK